MVVWISLIVIGGFIGLFARAKGHSFLLWWLYGAALPPIALPHSFFVPDYNGDEPWSLRRFGIPIRRRSCDQCGARVSDDDVICGNCDHRLMGKPAEVEASNELEKPDEATTALLDSAFARLADGSLKPGRSKTMVRGAPRPKTEQATKAAAGPREAAPATRSSPIETVIKPTTATPKPVPVAQPVPFKEAESKEAEREERIIAAPAERAPASDPFGPGQLTPVSAKPSAVKAPAAPLPPQEPFGTAKEAERLVSASPAATTASAPVDASPAAAVSTPPSADTRPADVPDPARPPFAPRSDEPSKAVPQALDKLPFGNEPAKPVAETQPSILSAFWRKLKARPEKPAQAAPLGPIVAGAEPSPAVGLAAAPMKDAAPAKTEKPEKSDGKPEFDAVARETAPEKPAPEKVETPIPASKPAPSPAIKPEGGAKPEPATVQRPAPAVVVAAGSAIPLRASPAQLTASPTARRTEPKLSRTAPRPVRPVLSADPKMAPTLKVSPDARAVPPAPPSTLPKLPKMSGRARIALGALAAALIAVVAIQVTPRASHPLSAFLTKSWDEAGAAVSQSTRPLTELVVNTWNEVVLGTADPIVRQGPASSVARRPADAPVGNAPRAAMPAQPSPPAVAPTPAPPAAPIPTAPRESSVAAATPKGPTAPDQRAAEAATPLLLPPPSAVEPDAAAAFGAMRPPARIPVPVSSDELMAMVEKALQGEIAGVAPISASGEVVAMVQQKLRERGYDPGAIDGRAGPRTRTAIRAYRQSIGLKPEGDLDLALMENLGIVGKQLTPFVRQ